MEEEEDIGAEALKDMDTAIQGWTKAVDELAGNVLVKIPKRTPKPIDQSCELESAAIPVDVALKAVHHAACKMAFRVLPRMTEKFLMSEFEGIAGRVALWFAAKKIAGFVPILGGVLGLFWKAYTKEKFFNELEAEIHAALGCKPNILEAAPSRWALNNYVRAMKKRVASESVIIKKVMTRKVPAK